MNWQMGICVFYLSTLESIKNRPICIISWKLGFVLKYKSLFRPLIKNYDSIAFTLIYLSTE